MTNSIFHAPTKYGTLTRHYLIFFITGNPGLISYYAAFLSTLHQLLESRSDGEANTFHVFGRSFDGFEDDGTATQPYGLQEQISHTFDAMQAQRISVGPRKGQNFDGIILMGHSVGSFVLLEVLQLARKLPDVSQTMTAGFLLFPTITHIAKSPSGVRFTALLRIPKFVVSVSALVRSVMKALPRAMVKKLVKLATGMPEDAASVTAEFLKSNGGVWQAL